MRNLVHKELADVLRRRGLRTRSWAVEWDESAIDFLLEKGFTVDLGARPLKRAIERYLLSPLALAIVGNEVPQGDQFLFVRARDGDRIEVEFIDPDAPDEEPPGVPALVKQPDELALEAIALDGQGTLAEVQFLERRFAELEAEIEGEEWQGRKDELLRTTQEVEFWEAQERFGVLGEIEYRDRIESGLRSARSLLSRLRGSSRRPRETFRADLVRRVAQQLYLLDAANDGLAAGEARDAFVEVRADDPAFGARIGAMYRAWAEKRGMQVQVLAEGHDGGRAPYVFVAAVSGFAAFSLLEPETGAHVFEEPEDERSFRRVRADVRVVPQPLEPPPPERPLLEHARDVLAGTPSPDGRIVRRYREQPSPLVRDSARGWRTGRLERVLGGDFDLVS